MKAVSYENGQSGRLTMFADRFVLETNRHTNNHTFSSADFTKPTSVLSVLATERSRNKGTVTTGGSRHAPSHKLRGQITATLAQEHLKKANARPYSTATLLVASLQTCCYPMLFRPMYNRQAVYLHTRYPNPGPGEVFLHSGQFHLGGSQNVHLVSQLHRFLSQRLQLKGLGFNTQIKIHTADARHVVG